ncbi:ATP-binding cassette domain-containing protein [Bosea sp. ANAM02]|uniref:ATP-binding cassette domain-containing protein n=1 Tax=Bosea sp. ANAM02 TaxID=2020412 RepID=UPI0015667778|nr:ATP-binding cassette domain-containing protein [Bosea sp. ANAM02]
MPGALVRLFAIGRTAARYGERLIGHKAALADQTRHRIALFDAMAAAPPIRAAGWQLADQARLADYLDDVEDIDFARLRSGFPAGLLLVGFVGMSLATLLVAPLALVPIAALVALAAAATWSFARQGAGLLSQIRAEDGAAAGALGAILDSAVPLRAEGRWGPLCTDALHGFSRADLRLKRLRHGQALPDALSAMPGPVAAAGTVAAAWLDGARAGDLLIPVFVAFSWLALGETAQGVSRIAVAALRARAARGAIARWTGRPSSHGGADAAPVKPLRLSCSALQRTAPDGRPLEQPLALDFQAGRPTILVGSSGAGKTSLLKQVAGWIGDDTLQGDGAALTASVRRSLAMLCLHDAAIIADTVRANLFAPSATDAEVWAALDAMELGARTREAGGVDGWVAQDMLSLGESQRVNLARAWLSTRPLILLDEPTEHLDAEQASRLIGRLLDRLSGKVVVISSHRPIDVEGCIELSLD